MYTYAGIQLNPLGYTQLTVSSTAVSLGTIPAGALLAVVIVGTQSIRVRDDGVDPATGVGMLFGASTTSPQQFPVTGGKALADTRLIRATGTDAEVNISFYGP